MAARTADAEKAHWLHARLSKSVKKVQLSGVRALISTPPRGFQQLNWVQGIEKNYNHCDNYYLYRGSHGIRVSWQRSGGTLRNTLKEGTLKFAIESPLRQDLRRHFGAQANALLSLLERYNRERPFNAQESADLVLNSPQRKFALSVAQKEGAFTKHLAEWVFHLKNWNALCANAAEQLTYYGKAGFSGGIPVPFFSKPSNAQKLNWNVNGAKSYVTQLSKALQDHQNWLDFDLAWVRKSRTTQQAAGDVQIFSGMTKVMDYRKALEGLMKKTEKDEIIKKHLLPIVPVI